MDIGSHAAIRQDRAAFEREQLFAGQGNLSAGWMVSGS